jgi:Uma2 family endonuclease
MTMLDIAPVAGISPDDIPNMDGLFELVHGRLVEKQMSSKSGIATVKLTIRLGSFVESNGLGELMSEVTFRCFPNEPKQVRRPDLAFIASNHLSAVPENGNVPIPPDLAIEIVSEGDTIVELEEKLIDYRAAAIPLIWIINPHARNIRIFRPGRRIEELGDADHLTGDHIVPGFSVPVSELFPPVAAKQS